MIWEATDTDSYTLLEYDNLEDFENHVSSRSYDLYQNFDKSSKVIYDNHFYYKSAGGRPAIIRYSLNDNSVQALRIPELTSKNLKHLYKLNWTYFDFNVDENGLWVIFAVPNVKNTGIVKINTNNMTIENAWNITLDHSKLNGMFIDSGILYTIETSETLKITTALDLYKQKYFILDLHLPMGYTPALSDLKLWYNHKNKILYVTPASSSIQHEYHLDEVIYDIKHKITDDTIDN